MFFKKFLNEKFLSYKGEYIFTKRFWKFLYQRIIRGFDDSDTWSLDYTIIKYTLPRLKRYKEITDGDYWPRDLAMEIRNNYIKKGYKFDTYDWQFKDEKVVIKYQNECAETWNNILDTIIEGFEYYIYFDKYEYRLKPLEKEMNKKLEKGTKKQKAEIRKIFTDIGFKNFNEVNTIMLQELKISNALKLFHKYFKSLWW